MIYEGDDNTRVVLVYFDLHLINVVLVIIPISCKALYVYC